MKIEVLGSGCSKCKKMYELTKIAAEQLNIKDKVEYITGESGISRILELGASSSPVISVDNRVVISGFTSDIEKIKKAIRR
ncbi:MAG: thioredoxin family protein [Candidatus Aenigmatarchaeota archaeon]|nr:thioredoxin family protein [Candidatus Aenigmarchaeota archaeon]